MSKILDISHHQRGINLANLKNVEGYIFRAAIGSSKYDDSVLDFINQALTVKAPCGFYTASYAKNVQEAVGEASYACDLADKYRANVTLPIFVDFEYFSSDYIKKTVWG